MLFWQVESTAELGEAFCREFDEFRPIHRDVFDVTSTHQNFDGKWAIAKKKWGKVIRALAELQDGLNPLSTLKMTQPYDVHCECKYVVGCYDHVKTVLDDYKRGARFRISAPPIPEKFLEYYPDTAKVFEDLEAETFLNRASAANRISKAAFEVNRYWLSDKIRPPHEYSRPTFNTASFRIEELPKFRIVFNLIGGGTDPCGEDLYDTEEEATAAIKELVDDWNAAIPEHNPDGTPHSLDDYGVEGVIHA